MSTTYRVCIYLALSLALSGCGNGIQQNIGKLAGTDDEKKDAMIELSLANSKDVPELISAASDGARPLEIRKALVTVLFRMALNQGDSAVRNALHAMIHDPAVELRREAVRALGDLQEKQSVEPISAALTDPDSSVVLEALLAMRKIEQHIEASEFPKLLDQARHILDNPASPELKQPALELLESAAERVSAQAQDMATKGQSADAEKLLLEVLKSAPDSKNINYKLGRFYFDNDQREKGLEVLARCGCLVRIKKFDAPPTLDGDLSDPCWQNATKIDTFYQCLAKFSAVPSQGKGEVRIGYTSDAIYIAYRAFEKSTKDIARSIKNRDGNVWTDDCTEIFFDTLHDYKTCYQIIVNSLGTVADIHLNPHNDMSWNAEIETKAKIEPQQWTVEIRIPIKDMGKKTIEPGAIWGFNITTTRCGMLSEQGQWVPTYGWSLRPERFGFLLFE